MAGPFYFGRLPFKQTDDVVWGNSLKIYPEQEGGDYESQDCCGQKTRFRFLWLMAHGDLLWLTEDAPDGRTEKDDEWDGSHYKKEQPAEHTN